MVEHPRSERAEARQVTALVAAATNYQQVCLFSGHLEGIVGGPLGQQAFDLKTGMRIARRANAFVQDRLLARLE
jgi:hypothetical protein